MLKQEKGRLRLRKPFFLVKLAGETILWLLDINLSFNIFLKHSLIKIFTKLYESNSSDMLINGIGTLSHRHGFR